MVEEWDNFKKIIIKNMNEIKGWNDFFNKKLNEEQEQEEEVGNSEILNLNINDIKVIYNEDGYFLKIRTPHGQLSVSLNNDSWDTEGEQ